MMSKMSFKIGKCLLEVSDCLLKVSKLLPKQLAFYSNLCLLSSVRGKLPGSSDGRKKQMFIQND